MKSAKIEQYFQMYYDCLRATESIEEVIENLPSKEYENYDELMKSLIFRFYQEKNMLEGQILDDRNLEIIDLLKEELIKITTIADTLNKEYDNKNKEDMKSLSLEQTEYPTDIIYLLAESGITMIERDLKSLPEEYIGSVKDLILQIRSGYNGGNSAKQRRFTNNNRLRNLSEVKDFKTRLCYRIIAPGVAIAIIALYKQADNDKSTRESIVKRVVMFENQIDKIIQIIENPEDRKNLIEEHHKLEEELIIKIDSLKRGGKTND
jgi:hypothetical protein